MAKSFIFRFLENTDENGENKKLSGFCKISSYMCSVKGIASSLLWPTILRTRLTTAPAPLRLFTCDVCCCCCTVVDAAAVDVVVVDR
uniref:Uncharacterized protein n=1 Tax=Romanomermis culicivorax TaxID=13658 RepID=A0A915K2H2_ROMCU